MILRPHDAIEECNVSDFAGSYCPMAEYLNGRPTGMQVKERASKAIPHVKQVILSVLQMCGRLSCNNDASLCHLLVLWSKLCFCHISFSILQVKVLRDPAKKDSKGNPQGKGIAFAEFSDPEHALCALRQLNNNPAPFGEFTMLGNSSKTACRVSLAERTISHVALVQNFT
jgi:hypothetical protein